MFSTLLVTTLLVGASIAQADAKKAAGDEGLGLCRPFADIEGGAKLFKARGHGVCGAPGLIRRVARRRLAVGLAHAAEGLEARLDALKTEAEQRRTRLQEAAAAARKAAEDARDAARQRARDEVSKAETDGGKNKKRQETNDREQLRMRIEAVTAKLRAAIMACNEKPAGERRACYMAARAESEAAFKAAREAAVAAFEERRAEIIAKAEADREAAIAKVKARLEELKKDAKACGDALKGNEELKEAIKTYKDARKAKPCKDAIDAFRNCPRETEEERKACRDTARETNCYADVIAAGKKVRELAKKAFDEEVCEKFKPKVRCLKLAKRRCFAIEGTDSECSDAQVSDVDAEAEIDFVRAKAAERFQALCGDDCKATQVTRICHGGARETGETDELTQEKRCRRFVCVERSVPDADEEGDERKRAVDTEFDTVFSAQNFPGAEDEQVNADGPDSVDIFMVDDEPLAFDDGETYSGDVQEPGTAMSVVLSGVAAVVAMVANF